MVSLEAADRPNFFLHATANGSVQLAKWQASDAFHHQASFALHRGTWRAGLVALESLAEPGAFLYVSGPVLALRLYKRTEAFRRGTLFRLLGRCLPCLTPASSAPHNSPPLLTLTSPFRLPPRDRIPHLPGTGRSYGCPLQDGRWSGLCVGGLRSLGQCGLGPSKLPGSCLLPQAIYTV